MNRVSATKESSQNIAVNPSWNGVYRAGGLSILSYLGLVMVGMIVFNLAQAPTSDSTGAAALQTIATHKFVFHLANIFFHLGLVFFIPMVVALYFALRDASRTLMSLATILALIGIATYLSWIFSLNIALVRLSDRYVAAATDSERVAYAAAADLDLGTQSGGEILGAILIYFWVPIASLSMLKANFNRTTAYVGLLSTVLTPIGVAIAIGAGPASPLAAFGLVAVLLLLLWFLLVGLKLYRMGRAA